MNQSWPSSPPHICGTRGRWVKITMVAILQTTFSNWFSAVKWLYSDSNVTDICTHGSNKQETNIGSDNGLVLNRWQAIIWTNYGPVCWRIYAPLCIDDRHIFSGSNNTDLQHQQHWITLSSEIILKIGLLFLISHLWNPWRMSCVDHLDNITRIMLKSNYRNLTGLYNRVLVI